MIYLIQESDSVSRQDQTQLDSSSESKKYEPVPSDASGVCFICSSKSHGSGL